MKESGYFPKVRPISKTAQHILSQRYFNVALGETRWDDVVNRVVDTILDKAPSHEKELTREMILNTYFVPNSPCLVNAGKPKMGLAACYVVDFKDDIREIFKTKLDFALVARMGGGCGTDLSKIRPEGDIVSGSTHGYAGGPIKFADTISHDADALTQAGFRSMAIMFTMSVYHPDILKFITAKHEEGRISNANMSVMVDDAFMNAVKNDDMYWTEFNGVRYKQYSARKVFELIIKGAHKNGEPGLLFKNRIEQSPYHEVGQEIFSTNPCSEQPLPPNGVCNLGSIDLSKLMLPSGDVDFEKLGVITRLAVKFLDKVIDKTTYPTEDIKNWSESNRPIGLGIMGFADLCLMKKIAYGSEESLTLLSDILAFISVVAEHESIELGKTPWYKKLLLKSNVPTMARKLATPRRNVTLMTIAPTGTISLFAGCSSGIEPIFSEITIRNDKTGTYTFENDLANQPYFRCAVASNGAQEVTWEEHIKVLATAQKYVDSGVSKTINFPKGTHEETMAKAAMLAWELRCKGVAMYRNESRKVQVLTPKNLKKDKCPICGNDLVSDGDKQKCVVCKADDVVEKTVGSYDN